MRNEKEQRDRNQS
jgi:hypothetical protein